MKACPVCATGLVQESLLIAPDHYYVPCPRCGPFRIDEAAAHDLGKQTLTRQKIGTLSGFLHENRDYHIKRDDLPRLLAMRPLTLAEVGARVMQWIANNHPSFGEMCVIQITDPAFQVAAWMCGEREANYVVFKYLTDPHEYLSPSGQVVVKGVVQATITAKGWDYIESLKVASPNTRDVFIAMSFDPSLNFIRDDTFYPTLDALGYRGFRVDDPATNNVIDDTIIAGIKRSKFIIADFTGQRPGVYYEAGFAAGLGLTVVRTCREDDRQNLHFDVNHYPFLFWSPPDLEDFKGELTDRIVSWVGRGPGAT